MPTKKQKGGLTQTANERKLWLATRPEMKAYYRDLVEKERLAQSGQGILDKSAVGKIIGPILQSMLTNGLKGSLHLAKHSVGAVNVLKKALLGRGKKPRAIKKK